MQVQNRGHRAYVCTCMSKFLVVNGDAISISFLGIVSVSTEGDIAAVPTSVGGTELGCWLDLDFKVVTTVARRFLPCTRRITGSFQNGVTATDNLKPIPVHPISSALFGW